MKRLFAIAVIFFVGWCVGAQSFAPPSQIGGALNPGPHTSCTVTASQTQICLASDGLWLSINGAPYVQVQTGTAVVGVTSISVNGSAPLSGAISLTIPSKAVTTSTTTIQ